ncbi:MAG: hypothetical protein G01um101425_993 [Candidatus Peregrinibacteria bacterium Gr01-1014_25]|nr:MAG: hypothetical protein G01um101425_993 [Candidatus Peregrinibacteria bacterium Gr01-1014_25]
MAPASDNAKTMTSRFGATIEHIGKDYASPRNGSDPVGLTANVLAKTYDALSGALPSVVGALSTREFNVVPRDGITASTRAALHNTLQAQWIKSGPGRILNVIPKAITAILEIPDGLVRDGIQMIGGGRSNDGYVVKSQ